MKKFKIITSVIAAVIIIWIFTRPDIYHPFSPHSAYERGFYMATGYWTVEEMDAALNGPSDKELDSLRKVRDELKREVDSILKNRSTTTSTQPSDQ